MLAEAPGLLVDWGVAAGALTAIIALLGLLWRGGGKIFAELVDQVDARVAKHTAPLEERLGAVEAEFRPNGGGSLRDQSNRIEERVEDIDGRLATVETAITLDPDAPEPG